MHINSGIPNRAFALADSQFTDAAQATLDVAEELFPGGEVRALVEDAWSEVEVVT